MKFSRYIFGTLLFSLVGAFSSCSDDVMEPQGPDVNPDDDGMVEVNFRFNIADLASTRGAEDETDGAITNLEDIDLLVYALRDENDKVLLQYGHGVDAHFKKADGTINKDDYPAFKYYNEELDNNQTLMYVGDQVSAGNWNVKFSLRVMRGTVFKLSVWAQSSKCTAYDFNFLSAVKVFYEDIDENSEHTYFLNNDVSRDAFCGTSKFSVGQVASDIQMTLTRPFARINVGVLDTEENKKGYDNYNYSEIKLGGAANYFNVIENKAWSQEDYNKYIDPNDSFGQNYNPAIFYDNIGDDPEKFSYRNADFVSDEITFRYNEIKNGNILVRDYSNWTGSGAVPPVKSYKSLSMCYVLVPEVTTPHGSDGSYDENGAATDKDGYVWLTVRDLAGNTVTLKGKKNGETWNWTIVKVNSEAGDEIALNTYSGVEAGAEITQTFIDDTDITVVLVYDIKACRWIVKKATNLAGQDVTQYYQYDDPYYDGTSSIYPGEPAEPQVTLQLMSMKLSANGTGTDPLVYEPEEMFMKVKRNWRTNLLFENWSDLLPKTKP